MEANDDLEAATMEASDDPEAAAMAVGLPNSEQHVRPGFPSSSGGSARRGILGMPWEVKQTVFKCLTSVEDAVSLASTCKAILAVFERDKYVVAVAILANGVGDPGLVRLALAYFESRSLRPWMCRQRLTARVSKRCSLCRLQRIESMEDWSYTLRPDRLHLRNPGHQGAMKVVAEVLAHHSDVQRLAELVSICDAHRSFPERVTRRWNRGRWNGPLPYKMDASFGPRQLMAMLYAYDILINVLRINPFGVYLNTAASKMCRDKAIDKRWYAGASKHLDRLFKLIKKLDKQTDWENGRYKFEVVLLGTGRVAGGWAQSFGDAIELTQEGKMWNSFPTELNNGAYVLSTLWHQMTIFGTVSLIPMVEFQEEPFRWMEDHYLPDSEL